jgi:DNA-directed RNA polymerase specialized sigma24 family protein
MTAGPNEFGQLVQRLRDPSAQQGAYKELRNRLVRMATAVAPMAPDSDREVLVQETSTKLWELANADPTFAPPASYAARMIENLAISKIRHEKVVTRHATSELASHAGARRTAVCLLDEHGRGLGDGADEDGGVPARGSAKDLTPAQYMDAAGRSLGLVIARALELRAEKHRPDLKKGIEQVLSLHANLNTMDALTEEELQGKHEDDSSGRPPKVKAQARLLTRHKRARDALRDALEDLVSNAAIRAEEEEQLRNICGSLLRIRKHGAKKKRSGCQSGDEPAVVPREALLSNAAERKNTP